MCIYVTCGNRSQGSHCSVACERPQGLLHCMMLHAGFLRAKCPTIPESLLHALTTFGIIIRSFDIPCTCWLSKFVVCSGDGRHMWQVGPVVHPGPYCPQSYGQWNCPDCCWSRQHLLHQPCAHQAVRAPCPLSTHFSSGLAVIIIAVPQFPFLTCCIIVVVLVVC